MGNRGPIPMPSEKKRLIGYRGLPKDEPMPQRGTPDKPAYLDGYASEVWDRVVYELTNLGVLTTIDGGALSRYCILVAEWEKAWEVVDREGASYTTTDSRGNTTHHKHPAMKIAIDLNRELVTLGKHYGLTPLSRSRLS